MKLVWTRTAYIDRKAIREYIAQDAPKAALKHDELIPNKLEKYRSAIFSQNCLIKHDDYL